MNSPKLDKKNAKIGGVCAGLSKSWDMDPLLLRIATLFLFLAGVGFVALIYLACWLIMDEESPEDS